MISRGSCIPQPWNVRHFGGYRTRREQYCGSVPAPGTCLPSLAFFWPSSPLVYCTHATQHQDYLLAVAQRCTHCLRKETENHFMDFFYGKCLKKIQTEHSLLFFSLIVKQLKLTSHCVCVGVWVCMHTCTHLTPHENKSPAPGWGNLINLCRGSVVHAKIIWSIKQVTLFRRGLWNGLHGSGQTVSQLSIRTSWVAVLIAPKRHCMLLGK